nr:hypothetical protein [Clavibacter zhangzhiyongii]
MRKKMTPGKKPASAAPRSARITRKLVPSQTMAWRAEKTPHVTMMRASQRRAPNRASARFEGISRSTYGRKKAPAARPKTAGPMPRSSFIVSAATPMFARSRMAMK